MNILGLSSSNAALSFIKTAALAAQKQAVAKAVSKTSTNPLIESLSQGDPAKAAAWREEQAQLQQTISQLQASRKNTNAERKEAARQKIEQLKAQIQALRMMANGDPKAVARQAARLARELASAAREYANSGGGNDMAAASTTTATATSTDSAVVADANAAGSVADTSVTADAGAVVSGAESAATLSVSTMKLSLNQDDVAFANETRGLMNHLKHILKQAHERMQKEGGFDTHEADHALRDTEGSVNAIMAGAMNVSVGVNVTA